MNYRDMSAEQLQAIKDQYYLDLQAVLDKAPQPITNEDEYNLAYGDRLMLVEADDFESDYINRPVFKLLTQYITNWENH